MEVRPPVWTLKQDCPVCGQGSCLALVSCPQCRRLAVVCIEEGTALPEPRDLSFKADGSSACRGCGAVEMRSFDDARDDAIRAFGFIPAEYE
jgi:hypothetical protein